ncbi:hypothetical protein TL16_g03596 [Triparma laevis f. inornata]|uniref:Uncharacterized protein n=1 Tax=Triparma laevis f. inornata TaxID=1714386 RepID=A0A9W7E5B0_9STRA|nr:hypothetical protein TL16_g03596 [Triparma laevis f. inornata]
MESAYGWETWYANNCDDECKEEQAAATTSDNDNEEENEEQEDEDEDEDEDEERRLRTTTRVLGSSSSSVFPGHYSTKDQFCANCMYDCDEYGDYAKVLNVWQYFAGEDEGCINTGIVSTTANSNGNYVRSEQRA